jgi:hypothetical protein
MKKQTKRQGVALVVSTKKPAKKAVKKAAKEIDQAARFLAKFKKENPKGGVYFESFIGPVKLIGVTKNTATSVNVHYKVVNADNVTGKVEVTTLRHTKMYNLKPFDIKKFLKEINSLYKKTYLS